MRPSRYLLPLVLCLVFLFGAELLFLPMPGIQEDEMLFALPFLHGHAIPYSVGSVPLMLMDYVGAVKTWIYWPILKILRLNVWSIRLPMCLVSLLTLWLFAEITRKISNTRTAVFAAALLATDAPFIFTNVFDWGPVALLQLSTVVFMAFVHRYSETGRRSYLAYAFFIAGLATWYKALFAALLIALFISWLIVYGRRLLTRDSIFAAFGAFALGAAPLIAFNIQHPLATLNASAYLQRAPAREKLMMFRKTLDGRALEHYMFRSSPAEKIQITGAPISELVEGWYRKSNFQPGGLLFPALILSLLVLPFLGESKPLWFAWIAMIVAVFEMLLFKDAGAGPHHTVLLYPAPQFIVAATAVALAERVQRSWLAVALVVLIAASNIWLLGQYAYAGRHFGFSVYWTDGVRNLARTLEDKRMPVAFLDWGIQNGVQVESGERVPITGDAPLREGVIYVTHCEGYVIDDGRAKQYQAWLSNLRLTTTNERVVTDQHGAPVFCLFQVASGFTG